MKDRSWRVEGGEGRRGSFVIVRNCIVEKLRRLRGADRRLFFIFSLLHERNQPPLQPKKLFHFEPRLELNGTLSPWGWTRWPIFLFFPFFSFSSSFFSSLSFRVKERTGSTGPLYRLWCTVNGGYTLEGCAGVHELHSWPALVHNYQSPKHAVC